MKPSITSKGWTIVMSILAVTFVGWSLMLTYLVNKQNERSVEYITYISNLIAYENRIRAFEGALTDELIKVNRELRSSTKKELAASYQDQLDQFDWDESTNWLIREYVLRADAFVNEMNSNLNDLAASPEDSTFLKEIVSEFHLNMNLALSETAEAIEILRKNMAILSLALANNWRYLNVALVVASCLILSSIVLLFRHRRALAENDRAAALLSESENRFLKLADTAPVMIWMAGKDGGCQYLNKEWLRFTGRRLEQELGNGWIQSFHPDDLKQFVRIYRASFDQRKGFLLECRLRRHDGQYCSTLLNGTPRFTDEQQFSGFIGTCLDVSSRKQNDDNLIRQARVLQAVVDKIDNGVVVVNRQGKLLLLNSAAVQIVGGMPRDRTYDAWLASQEIYESDGTTALALEDLPLVRALRGETCEARVVFVKSEQKPDGGYFFLNGWPLDDAAGKQIGAMMIMQDITELKRRETEIEQFSKELESRAAEQSARLQSSEKQFRQFCDRSPDAIFIEDLDGKIEYANGAAVDLIGVSSASDITGRPLSDFLSPEYHRLERNRIEKTLNYEEISWVPSKLVRLDGAIVEIEVAAMPFSAGDKIVAQYVIRDLTAQKAREKQLQRHTQELEDLVKERTTKIRELEQQRSKHEKLVVAGRMAARIAHEINNPLAAIQNSFRLIGPAVPKDHRYFHYVGRIEKEISRIAAIVRQMLDLQRPDQAPANVYRVADTVQEVASMLELNNSSQGVKVEVKAADPAATVSLPEGLLRQVLYNLIQNAIEASPDGGHVTVATEVSNGRFALEVQDHGEGIVEENRAKIFESFFTTKSGETSGGLGLGLSVCKNLVEAMRGKLEFESEVGKGTTFRALIPVDDGSAGGD